MPHDHATGSGLWLLIASVAVVTVVGMWHGFAGSRTLALMICVVAALLTLAARWEADVAVASAVRWWFAGFVLLGSIPVWRRATVARWAKRWQVQFTGQSAAMSSSTSATARAILVLAACPPYLVMAIYASASVVSRAGVPTAMRSLLDVLLVVTLVSLLAVAVLEMIPRARIGRNEKGQRGIPERVHAPLRNVLLLVGTGPLLVAGIFVVALALNRFPLLGPEPGTWFREIGWSVSYGVPFTVIALAFCGHAIRERSSYYAFSAGMLMNVVATIAYLLRLSKLNRPLDGQAWLEVAQCNSAVAAIVAIAWMAAIAWHGRRQDDVSARTTAWPSLLYTQTALAAALLVITLLPAIGALFVRPLTYAWIGVAGSIGAWAALGLTLAAIAGLLRGTKALLAIHPIGALLTTLAILIALSAARFDTGNWLAYHTWLCGFVTVACVMPLSALFLPLTGKRSTAIRTAARWSTALGLASLVLAVRALFGGPSAPWWTVAALLLIADLSILLAWLRRQRRYLWVMGILAHFAASLAWIELYAAGKNFLSGFCEFVLCNVAVAGLTSIVSVFVEQRRIANRPSRRVNLKRLSYHRLITWAAIFALLFTVGIGLLADVNHDSFDMSGWLNCAALGVLLLATVAALWDQALRHPIVRLYCLGLAACGMLLDSLNTSGEMFAWLATMLLACYSLLTSYLWSRRFELRQVASGWGIPLLQSRIVSTPMAAALKHSNRHGQGWLVSVNSGWAILVVMLVFAGVVHYEEQQQRLTTAYAILAEALAFGFLARGALRSALQVTALILGVLFAIAFGWSWLPVDMVAPVLHRAVVTMVAVAAMLPIYGLGLVKLFRKPNSWTRAAQGLLPPLIASLALLLIGVLGIEVQQYFSLGATQIVWPALVAVAITLVGLALAALAAAVLPGRDPLGLSERGRTLYVYAAEALLGLLFLHIRLTMPWLFHGWFMQFWPLIVMGLAFLGVGFSQWFQQRRQRVLAEPLENTGAILPLLPALSAWIVPNEVNYSLLLLSVAALYTMLSVLRKSFLFGILAAVAVNGSLWHLLHTIEGWGILQHPQLWLIPPALCVLVAAYLNRSRLSEQQFTLIRYQAAIVIYASSTADIFVNGVAEAPWLPLVLGGLSIFGIFAGIVLRVRAFLYLGVSFLMVALFTIIWYAAVELQRTWIWWISGIVAGVIIIAFFGLFEKKRDEMLRLVDELKHWDR